MHKKQCFVIMPFGQKTNVDGQALDFDQVYEHLIKPAIQKTHAEVVRCDKIDKPGWIHAEMIERIYQADVVVVDITTLNANVFYELGVRHALRPSVTVLIRKKGTTLPFNLQGLNVIEYETEFDAFKKAKTKIADFIKAGLSDTKSDSLVHNVLDLKITHPSRPLHKRELHCYRLADVADKEICIVTGDIQYVKGIDVWVSSENTNMQMARFFDRSISSVIRYLGAEKDKAGHVTKDTIADELDRIMGASRAVPDAMIIPTTGGHLETTHGVKRLLHAAAVSGALGRGYQPISDIARCITNALAKLEEPQLKNEDLTTILFPLLGVGTAKGDLLSTAQLLIETAIAYLSSNPASKIRRAYFLAWSQDELTACQKVLDHSSLVSQTPGKVN